MSEIYWKYIANTDDQYTADWISSFIPIFFTLSGTEENILTIWFSWSQISICIWVTFTKFERFYKVRNSELKFHMLVLDFHGFFSRFYFWCLFCIILWFVLLGSTHFLNNDQGSRCKFWQSAGERGGYAINPLSLWLLGWANTGIDTGLCSCIPTVLCSLT